MSSFARSALLWLATAAVKAQDELAALSLDGRRSQPKDYPRSGQRKTSDMNLPKLKLLDSDRPSHGRPMRSLSYSSR